jgi:hypothetical protein
MLSPAGVEGGGVKNVSDSMQCEAAGHVKRYEALTSRRNGTLRYSCRQAHAEGFRKFNVGSIRGVELDTWSPRSESVRPLFMVLQCIQNQPITIHMDGERMEI